MPRSLRSPIDGGTIVITGASSGIGQALARQVAGRAATVVVLARRADRLEDLRAEILARHSALRVITLPVDLTDQAALERAVENIRRSVGPVDVLINNAGVGDQSLFDRTDWQRTRQILSTNIVGLTYLTWALVPDMVARGRGGVLNVGSGAGRAILPAAAAYTASKHYVDGFTEALRADLAGTGVLVTQVLPGPVDSEFDATANSTGGMRGGPPGFLRIDADRCAADALIGFDQGRAVVYPGRAYRVAMHLLPLLPRSLQRRQAARAARAARTARQAR